MSLNNKVTAQYDESEIRPLPNDLGAEKSLLSLILQAPVEYIERAHKLSLTAEMFYEPSHQTLFNQLVELIDSGDKDEQTFLYQDLKDQGLLKDLGETSALTEIYEYATTESHFDHYLNFIKDKFVQKNSISASTEPSIRSFEDQEEITNLSAEHEKEFSIKNDVNKAITNFKSILAGGDVVTGLKSGYLQLDKMSRGLKPGEMFVIAAHPSMGKTSFAMNIIENICLDSKLPAMFFSCEMNTAQLVERLLYTRARYSKDYLSDGLTPSKHELMRIKSAATEIAESTLFIADSAGISISISELRAKARRKKRELDIQVIVVDSLQRVKSSTEHTQNSKEHEIAEVSADLKALAIELEIPIIVLAQLSYESESLGRAPRVSSLRECASIEQDADMIGLLYRPACHAIDQEGFDEYEGIAELNLVKNRNGSTGIIPLTYINELTRFENSSSELNYHW